MRLLFALLFLPFITEAQELILKKDGCAPVVYEFSGLSADSLYKKSVSWVKDKYRKPSEVLVADLPGEKIRISAFMPSAYFIKQLGQKLYYDMYYELEVEFKDGKIRVTYTPGQITGDGRKMLFDVYYFFKEDGSVKNAYKDAIPSLNESINGLVRSLIGFITAKKSDW